MEVIIIYATIFIVLVYLFFTTRKKDVIHESVQHESEWWPWKITVYNWWPEWLGSSRRHVLPPAPSSVSHARPWGGASRHANAPRTH